MNGWVLPFKVFKTAKNRKLDLNLRFFSTITIGYPANFVKSCNIPKHHASRRAL
jgi:hypothetical protein